MWPLSSAKVHTLAESLTHRRPRAAAGPGKRPPARFQLGPARNDPGTCLLQLLGGPAQHRMLASGASFRGRVPGSELGPAMFFYARWL